MDSVSSLDSQICTASSSAEKTSLRRRRNALTSLGGLPIEVITLLFVSTQSISKTDTRPQNGLFQNIFHTSYIARRNDTSPLPSPFRVGWLSLMWTSARLREVAIGMRILWASEDIYIRGSLEWQKLCLERSRGLMISPCLYYHAVSSEVEEKICRVGHLASHMKAASEAHIVIKEDRDGWDPLATVPSRIQTECLGQACASLQHLNIRSTWFILTDTFMGGVAERLTTLVCLDIYAIQSWPELPNLRHLQLVFAWLVGPLDGDLFCSFLESAPLLEVACLAFEDISIPVDQQPVRLSSLQLLSLSASVSSIGALLRVLPRPSIGLNVNIDPCEYSTRSPGTTELQHYTTDWTDPQVMDQYQEVIALFTGVWDQICHNTPSALHPEVSPTVACQVDYDLLSPICLTYSSGTFPNEWDLDTTAPFCRLTGPYYRPNANVLSVDLGLPGSPTLISIPADPRHGSQYRKLIMVAIRSGEGLVAVLDAWLQLHQDKDLTPIETLQIVTGQRQEDSNSHERLEELLTGLVERGVIEHVQWIR